MRHLNPAFAAIDTANAEDPRLMDSRPLALVQGERCWDWVRTLSGEASDALLLAARAHHLRRWELPRSDYRAGRSGYLSWRREQKRRHAAHLRAILEALAISQPTIDRATEIIQKKGLDRDAEVQTFEDAVCLTFLETEYATTAQRISDPEKMASIVAKTLHKMSPEGRAHATLPSSHGSSG